MRSPQLKTHRAPHLAVVDVAVEHEKGVGRGRRAVQRVDGARGADVRQASSVDQVVASRLIEVTFNPTARWKQPSNSLGFEERHGGTGSDERMSEANARQRGAQVAEPELTAGQTGSQGSPPKPTVATLDMTKCLLAGAVRVISPLLT